MFGRFLAQASSFLNYIAEEAFKDRFVQQSLNKFKKGFSVYSLAKDLAVSRTVIQRIIEKYEN
ncbi:helix-turn-helix domain-containing protein [Acinetobacter baumannii]|uniref:helix-turn-helix domain-containing protein n=1 Tax=Acinetobacter baumannii TaxID=470 RepID=UPI0038917CFA